MATLHHNKATSIGVCIVIKCDNNVQSRNVGCVVLVMTV